MPNPCKIGPLRRVPPMGAFTLVELLVVVAIISILATTAMPNFQEALTRAKVTRAQAELKVVNDAYTMYHIDNNGWPNHLDGDEAQHKAVTTPIAYLSSSIIDIFQESSRAHNDITYLDSRGQYHCEPRAAIYQYLEESDPAYAGATRNAAFYVWSFGPDNDFDGSHRYDATNGVKSSGDIYKEITGAFSDRYPYTRIYPLGQFGPPPPPTGPYLPGREPRPFRR